MPDYKNGNVYINVCNATGKVYIGSTTQTLSMRLAGHRDGYKRFANGKYHNVSSFEIIQHNNYDIVLIENISCESKEELHRRERYFIETLVCVNKTIPTRTQKEQYQVVKVAKVEYNKKYKEKNKDKIKEHKKESYEKNKEEILKKMK